MKKIFLLFSLLIFSFVAVAGIDNRHRVIVSTDIGGTDPDDFQSMVHLLLYADVLDIEGLISSPFGPGRKTHILEVIDQYEKDFPKLRKASAHYPTPKTLRAMTKQGETKTSPYKGYRQSTEGSNWIIQQARVNDPRPLHILVWGGIEDLAQALHDAPDILPKIRVYYIGGPNKKWGPNAYQYIAENHPNLWIIESNATYRGWFVGGNQQGEWSNQGFVKKHIAPYGALGDYFANHLEGTIKMGDTPSVAWLLNGDPSKPSQASWGGQYQRAWTRPIKVFNDLTTKKDEIEEFGIFELVLPVQQKNTKNIDARMIIENQKLPGHIIGQKIHFRFSPKAARVFEYSIESNSKALNGLKGALTATATKPTKKPDPKLPNWWTDNPSKDFIEDGHIGIKTVNRWRVDFLSDFSERMKRLQ